MPFGFHWEDGQRIRSFYVSRRKAVAAAGCPGRFQHDLRRTAVRHFDRCGIPRSVAMKLSGHLTESVFKRYSIAASSDPQVAAAQLDAAAGTNSADLGTRAPLATTPQAN